MFSRVSVCLFAGRITQKVSNRFPRNLDGGWVSAQSGTPLI